MKTASWILVEKATGNAIAETFLPHVAEAVNTAKYKAVPVLEYLAGLNRQIKQAESRDRKNPYRKQ